MAQQPKITCITPTVRPEGLRLVEKAFKRQTFRDFEWIIVSPVDPGIATARWIPDPGKQPGDYWSIYKAYNAAIRQASGELIVSWQDWTYADPEALERFWTHYQQEPETLVTAVGNKYSDETFTVETWRDPRISSHYGSYYPCYYNDIEWNLCAVPKAAIYAVGGFDEELDKYSSLCGLDVLDRLHLVGGWDFKIDQAIKSYSLEHGRLPEWEEHSPFHGAYDQRRQTYLRTPVLAYLLPAGATIGL